MDMVGTAGFEPATTTPPVWCATRLRYAPNFCACTPQCGALPGCATPRSFALAHHSVVRLSTTIRAALRPEVLRLHTTVWCGFLQQSGLRYAPKFCACTPQCGAAFYNNQGCATPRSFALAHHSVVRLSTTIRAALRPEVLRLHTTVWCGFIQLGLRYAPNFCACTPQCGAAFYNNQGCATPRIFALAHHRVVRLSKITKAALSPVRPRLYAINKNLPA